MLQLAMICDHLRPILVRAARRAGAGEWSEDVVADVVARRFRIVAADAPITLATPHAFSHLTASLLVSVKNAAMSHRRDTARVRPAPSDEVAALIDHGGRHGQPARGDRHDELRALSEALRNLCPRDAQIARLIGIHEMTVRDVAERLGIGASTVHDVWSRVQRTIGVEVERVLSGAICRQAAPHLALIATQYRSDRAGDDDRSLSDLVGVATARRLVSHVFGSGDLIGGCPACRSALARQRQLLHHGLPVPVPVLGLAGGESSDAIRESLTRVWHAATTSLARMSDALWGVVNTNPIPGTAGAAATTLGLGASKIAAVIAASALATSTPALVTGMRSSGRAASHHPVAKTSKSVTAASAPATPDRRSASTTPSRSVGTSSTRSVSTATKPRSASRASTPAPTTGQTRATAEFSPGP